MKINSFNQKSLVESVGILENGGVVCYGGDTCYGLCGDFLNKKSLNRIQKIKGRDDNKPMSIMFCEDKIDDIFDYIDVNDFSRDIVNKLLPGPITILFKKGKKVPDWYFPDNNMIGIRVPDDNNIQNILRSFNGPLITTSANLSGEPACYSSKELINIFKNREFKPDLFFDDGNIKSNPPSTIIKINNGEIEVIREGGLSKKDVEELLK